MLSLLFLLALAPAKADLQCSRVDLRPKLEALGWPRMPHAGGRSSLPLAHAEALSLHEGKKLALRDASPEKFRNIESPDAALDAGKIAVVEWRIATTIVARRYSPEKDRCEWLVRMMNGPFCDPKIESPCEDGAVWVARDDAKRTIKNTWVVR